MKTSKNQKTTPVTESSDAQNQLDETAANAILQIWPGFVIRNQTLDEEILISGVELSEIKDEIQEIRELLIIKQLREQGFCLH